MDIQAMTSWLTASVSPSAHDRRMIAIGKGHSDG
jgi:hypothetical protein